MLQINLSQNKGFAWSQTDNTIHGKGFFFDLDNNDQYYEKNALTEYLAHQTLHPDILANKLKALDGAFAIVIEMENVVFAAVDRVRGIPLFYAKTADNFYLTDDAEWLRQQVGDTQLDPISKIEYKLTGYVTGSDTLYHNVKQLCAGEYLIYQKATHQLSLKSYFQFQRGQFYNQAPADLIEQLDQVHQRVFQRLIRSLNGRTAVLPLSGGYDSRLIAVMLKRLGYEKVICFSYGKADNWESNTSAKIAKYLNYPWHYVNYNLKQWQDWYHSEAKTNFYRFSQYHTAIPYIQDLLAVNHLRAQGLLPEDAVLVPGHSGDFLAGSHVSYELIDGRALSAQLLINLIYKYHYGLWSFETARKHELFDAKMTAISQLPLTTPEEISIASDLWDWQERQAKFIVNSVRAFEFNDFEWRLPLWDKELMDFWCHIDFDNRLERRLYMQYVNQYQGEMNEHLQLSRCGIEAGMLQKPAVNPFSLALHNLSIFPRYMHYYFTDKLQITRTIKLPQFIMAYFRGANQAKSILIEDLLKEL